MFRQLSHPTAVLLFFFNRQMFVIAKVGCDAWWLALVIVDPYGRWRLQLA